MCEQQPFGSAFLQHLADDAECEHWRCHQLPDGEHHDNCLNRPEPDTTN
ncbi:hypothetical protein [Streptomyces vietnamensis]